ncbi:MAG: hypothetical protein QNJ46_05775 [Leptolyngbyaceae cyanobacterium MO_188.B28]|nr:hypothetical protein [Leptolyngbyaceae cyanobacterium MO_188.B28]
MVNSLLVENEQISEDQMKIEADVIVTATVLGFVGIRYSKGQPCRFDIEHPAPDDHGQIKFSDEHFESIQKELQTRLGREHEESVEAQNNRFLSLLREKNLLEDFLQLSKRDRFTQSDIANNLPLKLFRQMPNKANEFTEDNQEFGHVIDAMATVLDRINTDLAKWLKDGQSPAWAPGGLITGFPGGGSKEFSERHEQIESELAQRVKDRMAAEPERFAVYQGRGAYTGMISDPQDPGALLVKATKRVIDDDPNRWHPGQNSRVRNADTRWGLISPERRPEINLNPDKTIGMGPLPRLAPNIESLLRSGGARIGYIHGMSSAIHECYIRNTLGGRSANIEDLAIPFEMATGKVTTKMASCFACCTYMYATDYPPSSMHLGRGESWIPPAPHLVSGETSDMPSYNDSALSVLAAKWHGDVFEYMREGTDFLKHAIDLLNPSHKRPVELLHARLQKILIEQNVPRVGGNLFIDALTVHESDWKRIRETLRPVYDDIAMKAGSFEMSLSRGLNKAIPVESTNRIHKSRHKRVRSSRDEVHSNHMNRLIELERSLQRKR